MKSIKVFAPATVANVTCGFDILGFAVDEPGDEVILTLKETKGVVIHQITGDDGRLPLNATQNTVGASIISMLKYLNSNQGVEIILNKKMPFGSGLGSSAASAAAGSVALNELLGTKLDKQQLVKFAMEGEKVASGAAHADNVAPAIYGGFVLIRSYNPLDIIQIPAPNDLYCSLVHPHLEISTKEARALLSPQVSLKDTITQCGNVAGLITGLITNNYALIGRSMQDIIAEPVRSKLIPGFETVKKHALLNNALGVGISGSGPSIFALSTSKDTANNIAQIMQAQFNKLNIGSDTYVSQINMNGVKVIS